MAPTPHRTRVRPSPSKSKSPRRRVCAAGFDSDNDEAPPARYHVSVRSAKNLKREGFRGLTNPYCQLSVGRQGPYQTDVVFDSVNPSWEHKRETFEFREGKGPQEDKLTLACFNSGDVPELIGRLSMVLSHATHKVISLPMFRKDLGGSQVWAGSVEIELHYVPEGQSGGVRVDSTRGGRVFAGADGNSGSGRGRDRTGGGGNGNSYPPLSPCSTSLASSFVKAAKSLPEKARASGAAAAASAAVVQADLLALSPRTARGAETAAAAGRRYAGRGGGGGDGAEKGGRGHAGGQAASGSGGGGGGGGDGGWKSFFSGVLCTLLLVLGALWALGDPLLMSAQFGLGLTVLEDGGAGRQAVVLIHGSKISWLADRHLVVFVGEQEVCRGGVPAPAPPTEGSNWAYDLWSSEAVAAAAAAGGEGGGSSGGSGGGGGGKGGSGRARGAESQQLVPPHRHHQDKQQLQHKSRQQPSGGGGGGRGGGDGGMAVDCGRWCSFVQWQADFVRRLAAPLYAARRGGAPGTP